MNKPRVGKAHIFVRARGGNVEHTMFIRHADSSAGFAAVELREAIATGLVPEGWQPTPEAFVLESGQATVREA